MHPNPVFRNTVETRSIEFLRARSFGSLIAVGVDGPMIAHVPFLLNDAAEHLDLHLVRSNPIARVARSTSLLATLAVTGPDSYISPDWYGVPDQVPTWNYVAVHLTGTLEPLPQSELRDVLDHLSAHFEGQLAPKPVWTANKMDKDALEKMMRAIVPFRFHISSMNSTWKLGQNKTPEVRQAAAAHVQANGIGSEPKELGALMMTPPETKG